VRQDPRAAAPAAGVRAAVPGDAGPGAYPAAAPARAAQDHQGHDRSIAGPA